jgi:signal transduction histidine kinase
MVQDVAHDLRTPLTSIKGATQNLLDDMAGPLSDSAREYIEIVGDQGERLIGIVNWLLVDPDKLLLVLENLVGNALKFTESGGKVSVLVRPVDQTVEITVADTGIGLSSDEVEHVFDRYYRSSHPRGGSGLGLSISRELVRLHGGDVALSSEMGKGSTFVVTLPSDCRELTALALQDS